MPRNQARKLLGDVGNLFTELKKGSGLGLLHSLFYESVQKKMEAKYNQVGMMERPIISDL